MTADQKHRNAYKRAWRNKRNYERLTAEIGDLNAKRAQSFRLWQYAESELWVTR